MGKLDVLLLLIDYSCNFEKDEYGRKIRIKKMEQTRILSRPLLFAKPAPTLWDNLAAHFCVNAIINTIHLRKRRINIIFRKLKGRGGAG